MTVRELAISMAVHSPTFVLAYTRIFFEAFAHANQNRVILAKSAGRVIYSSAILRRFVLYVMTFPFVSIYLLIMGYPPRDRIHLAWADSIRAINIPEVSVIRLPFPTKPQSTIKSWLLSYILWFSRLFAIFRVPGISAKIEYLAFMCESFIIDCALFAHKTGVVSSASALDRKSIYISSVCQSLSIRHIVYQHGVINKFAAVHIPSCDVFICCFPWSVNAVEWIYNARTVEVLAGEFWYFPGWSGECKADVLWATSPFGASEVVRLIKHVKKQYPNNRVSVKLHPRDNNLELYLNAGFDIIATKPLNSNKVIGQISTVLAEAYVLGIPVEVIAYEEPTRESCLMYAGI